MKIGRWTIRISQSEDPVANTEGVMQPQVRFRAAIKRERRRVDRNQHTLSLLLFAVGERSANAPEVQHFIRTLIKRIRSTDEVGWFDGNCIGVILPYTHSDGAHRLAEAICKEATCKAAVTQYAIHTYPSDWFSDDGGPDAKSGLEGLTSKCAAVTSQRPFSAVRRSIEAGCQSGALSAMIDSSLMPGATAQGLELLLLRPQPAWKRAVDVFGALFGLVILSPLLLLVALIVRVCNGKPVIYKQQRVGYSGKVFTMWKFRTMKQDDSEDRHQRYMSQLIDGTSDGGSAKAMTKLDDDLPITRFGRWLRATSIDELPQLVNVLRGDMSLIGPRPPTTYEVENYSPWQYERFASIPGMTGLWQVSGKNTLSFTEMIRLDIRYVRGLSLWSDIIILLKTPIVVVNELAHFLNLYEDRGNLEEI